MKKIILASTSPRRKEILEKLRIPFEIETSSYKEDMSLNFPPDELAKHLSYEKAKSVALKHNNAIIIGADTFISFEGKVLGKPKSKNEAKEMLKNYSGKYVSVFTGFTIIDAKTKNYISKAVETKVFFKNLSKEEIEGYIKSGEPMDKSGAFASQGLGSVLIEKIDGDALNVIGLPMSALVESLKKFNINIWANK